MPVAKSQQLKLNLKNISIDDKFNTTENTQGRKNGTTTGVVHETGRKSVTIIHENKRGFHVLADDAESGNSCQSNSFTY